MRCELPAVGQAREDPRSGIGVNLFAGDAGDCGAISARIRLLVFLLLTLSLRW